MGILPATRNNIVIIINGTASFDKNADLAAEAALYNSALENIKYLKNLKKIKKYIINYHKITRYKYADNKQGNPKAKKKAAAIKFKLPPTPNPYPITRTRAKANRNI